MKNFNNMTISSVQLFNNMTDEDFMFVHEAGKLKEFCLALSLDLQESKKVKKKKFEA